MAEAAEIGTRKVIAEHSTIGIVVTTDGSITDLPREAYVESRGPGDLRAQGAGQALPPAAQLPPGRSPTRPRLCGPSWRRPTTSPAWR